MWKRKKEIQRWGQKWHDDPEIEKEEVRRGTSGGRQRWSNHWRMATESIRWRRLLVSTTRGHKSSRSLCCIRREEPFPH